MYTTLLAAILASQAVASPVAPAHAASSDPAIARGRYLVQIGGCNDCHTPGFAQSGGQVPEAQWLTGDALGWSGPWGTTYPPNLRLSIPARDETAWVKYAHTLTTRPPMPYWALNTMQTDDLRAIYRFVSSLGAAGVPAPTALAPGVEAKGPVVRFPAPPPQAVAATH